MIWTPSKNKEKNWESWRLLTRKNLQKWGKITTKSCRRCKEFTLKRKRPSSRSSRGFAFRPKRGCEIWKPTWDPITTPTYLWTNPFIKLMTPFSWKHTFLIRKPRNPTSNIRITLLYSQSITAKTAKSIEANLLPYRMAPLLWPIWYLRASKVASTSLRSTINILMAKCRRLAGNFMSMNSENSS